MNDCYGSSYVVNKGPDEFFYEAQANCWLVGSEYDYYKTCFDVFCARSAEVFPFVNLRADYETTRRLCINKKLISTIYYHKTILENTLFLFVLYDLCLLIKHF